MSAKKSRRIFHLAGGARNVKHLLSFCGKVFPREKFSDAEKISHGGEICDECSRVFDLWFWKNERSDGWGLGHDVR
jgi:hypothetical protein